MRENFQRDGRSTESCRGEVSEAPDKGQRRGSGAGLLGTTRNPRPHARKFGSEYSSCGFQNKTVQTKYLQGAISG